MTAQDYFEPATYGDGTGAFIANLLYTTPDVGMREMAANAIDQYLEPTTQMHEHWNELYIDINPILRTYRQADYATGIVNIEDFKVFLRQGGKVVGSTTSSYDNPDNLMIGQYHVGKASYMKMSEREFGDVVTFYNNNGNEGHIFTMKWGEAKILGWNKVYNYRKEDATTVRPDIGLTVEVSDVISDLLSMRHVTNALSKQFGILIARGLKIYVRDSSIPNSEYMRVLSPKDLNTKGELHKTSELQLVNGTYISHVLENESNPKGDNIDIYVKHVYIKSIHVDYKVRGWVNCNSLQLNGARDGFQVGPKSIYREFEEKLLRYLKANYEPLHKPKENKSISDKEIDDILSDMTMSIPDLFDKDQIPLTGEADNDGIIQGIIEEDENGRRTWVKKSGKKLTKNSGNPEDGPLIPIGPGRRKRGKRWKGKGDQPGVEDGGDHDIVTQIDEGVQRPKTGPIKIHTELVDGKLGTELPIVHQTSLRYQVLNEDQPCVEAIKGQPKSRMIAMLRPMLADAMVEFIVRGRPQPPTIMEYRQMCTQMLTKSLMSGRDK
jgi:hypothetical protein